ncbi:uncharacterized protein LOC129948379 [Eupeodes corollae]|uniref:uncharacterized protein LOC129948379 n=1 Tax=Eupeodes corollae TaxID=290404 RepID=UPI002490BD39|nr:uncharacterized protein LOC129948379 [Eupeodes corollae]
MPFIEVINRFQFEFYQINGTKYYKNVNPCSFEVKEQLEKCAGEMFLSGIPEHITADQIANVACLLGEMYILRFKVNFAGLSRGFAYLQYMNPSLMDYALQSLPYLFMEYKLGNIHVQPSKNNSNLVLRYTTGMTTEEVHNTLAEMCNFQECNVRYFRGNRMEFQLVFGSNEDAVRARRNLLGQVHMFGELATIGWDIYKN